MKKIKKILIANRGEIAARIIRTCKEMDIQTVAIYSDVDSAAPHVLLADESYHIGSPQAIESYLNQEKIVSIAIKANVDAIHPGYGFLSENSDFVDLVQKSGIIFIGPPANAMRLLGDKTAARQLAKSNGIPITPGNTEPVKSDNEAFLIAESISYPILLKAAGGGGGKGMRIVHNASELTSALRSARSEALSAFDDDRIYIEKYIDNPRHIEVQILADQHGNVVHFGERECTIQRRHQKIIEESPSVIVDEELREKLTSSATQLAKCANYYNAGTVEFLVDRDKNFYFLEVNTRLQVEHPVSEMRTGFDLVREQILIAEGEPIRYQQNDILFNGHSIECRLYAEDPLNNFFPSIGTINWLKPCSGLFVREDRGVESGMEISPYYDPIISKLVVWGRDRKEAIERMIRCLKEYELYGVHNNINLCLWVISHPKFREGEIDTHFLEKYFKPALLEEIPMEFLSIASAITTYHDQNSIMKINKNEPFDKKISSKWKMKRNEYLR